MLGYEWGVVKSLQTVCRDLPEKGKFEQRQEVNNGASQVNIWEKSVCKEKTA